MSHVAAHSISPWRRHVVLALFVIGALVLVWRVIDLQVINNQAYQDKGDSVHLKNVNVPAHRGMIVDRNNVPLAISTPVNAIWAMPQQLLAATDRLPELANVLGVSPSHLEKQLKERLNREFVYLKRRGAPELVEQVRAMKVPGVYFQREYKRYYPAGEVTSHLLGLTDIDDQGQEGVELAYNRWLQGKAGEKRILQDRLGNTLADIELIEEARNGGILKLAIDKHIQYLAYRELKAAVEARKALSGSMVVLDALTGEVLAMVNQPAFNPNARHSLSNNALRNRAVTDAFEPGSTVKPFIAAAALESGQYSENSLINTSPGQVYVGRNRVRDIRDFGLIDVSTVIQKSSNVGVVKLALAMDKQYVWQTYVDAGFSTATGIAFPGEQLGYINDFHRWSRIDQATIAFGYGLSTTALQLARSYTVFANQGRLIPVSLQHIDTLPEGRAVFKPQTAQRVLNMMEGVVANEGTAPLAKVPGYRVAGKTGTVKKPSEQGGYTEDKYLSVFAGLVPASQPRLIAVVVVDEPQEEYYGGVVAAPVFAKVMAGALSLLNIPPDNLDAKRNVNKVAQHTQDIREGAL